MSLSKHETVITLQRGDQLAEKDIRTGYSPCVELLRHDWELDQSGTLEPKIDLGLTVCDVDIPLLLSRWCKCDLWKTSQFSAGRDSTHQSAGSNASPSGPIQPGMPVYRHQDYQQWRWPDSCDSVILKDE